MAVKVRRNVTIRAEGYNAVTQAVEALAAEVEDSQGKAVRLTVDTVPGRYGWSKVVAKLTSIREAH